MKHFFGMLSRALRLVAGVLLGFVVSTLLVLALHASAVSWTATHREYPKSWLLESEAYTHLEEAAVDFAIASAERESPVAEGQQQEFEKGAQDLFSKVVNRQMYERLVNGIVDGVYDWLEGETEKPTFNIKVFESKQQFLKFLGFTFKQKLANLPKCEGPVPPKTDLLSLECRPPSYEPSQVDELLQKNKNNSELNKLYDQLGTISGESLNLDEVENPEFIKQVFQFAKWLPLVFLAAIALLSYLWRVVLMGMKNSRKAFGRLFLSSGFSVSLSGGLALIFQDRILKRLEGSIQGGTESVINIAGEVLSAALVDIAHIWLGLGVAGLVLGLVFRYWPNGVIFLRKIKAKSSSKL